MSGPAIACATDPDEAYITWRVVDCCLREDLHAIATRGRREAPPMAVLRAFGEVGLATAWWRVDHWPGGTVWLPVRRSDSMQAVAAVSDGWVRIVAGVAISEHGARRWLDVLANGRDAATRELHERYAEEADCAVAHRVLAREAFAANAAALAATLDHAHWAERALRADQVASHRDHPFYPTARAKLGFDAAALRAWAPEFDAAFALRWLAVPSDRLTRTGPPPAFWPRAVDVGLPAGLDATHALVPVHPATFERLDAFPLPPGTRRAPLAALHVRPTLSVRTVALVDHPRHHLKLPLLMRTLGALNLRLIKPSTLYDGHWFERVLRALGECDPALKGAYEHVDESHGGHVDDARHLAYLLRVYPESLGDATIVPAAALCAPLPDGRPMALHLADRFHGGDALGWWRDYASLLSRVHLRLWLVHGIALESNQQNSVLVYRAGRAPTLLMKDNDAARVLLPRLRARLPGLHAFGDLQDRRIEVEDDAALARMVCTITLQLCLVAVLEGVAESRPTLRRPMYDVLREAVWTALAALDAEGVDIAPALALLHAPRLPVKYLLSAGSLLAKEATGAADINKFYGDSAPNFMHDPPAHVPHEADACIARTAEPV